MSSPRIRRPRARRRCRTGRAKAGRVAAPVPVQVHPGLNGFPRSFSYLDMETHYRLQRHNSDGTYILIWDTAAQPAIQERRGSDYDKIYDSRKAIKSGSNNHDNNHVSFRFHKPCRELHVSILCSPCALYHPYAEASRLPTIYVPLVKRLISMIVPRR